MTPCKNKKSQPIAGDEWSQLEKDKLKQLTEKIGQELSIRLLNGSKVTVKYITNLFTKMTSSLSQTQINHVKSTVLKSIIRAARGPENKHRDRLSAYFSGGVEIGLVTFALLFDNTAPLSYGRVHLCPEELSDLSNKKSLYNYLIQDFKNSSKTLSYFTAGQTNRIG